MLKNIPVLSFDKDQNIWCLDFLYQANGAPLPTMPYPPDNLSIFLQKYRNNSINSPSLSFDHKQIILGTNFPFHRVELFSNQLHFKHDNLSLFLEEHWVRTILGPTNV